MRRTRHSAEQIVSKLREADAMLAADRSVPQVGQALGVNELTYARWRAQYGGIRADEAKRLKELEIENPASPKVIQASNIRQLMRKQRYLAMIRSL